VLKSPRTPQALSGTLVLKDSNPTASKWFSDELANYFSVASKAGIVIIVGFVIILLRVEWKRDALVVEPLDTPKELQDLGLTGSVMSQLLADHVLQLQRNARFDDDPSDIVFVELPKLQVDLPLGASWSVRGAVRYLKQSFGKPEQRLVGEVVKKRSAYVIRLRTSAGWARDVSVAFHGTADLEAALESAAEGAVFLTNPFEAASISRARENTSSGFVKTREALQRYLATAPAQRHEGAYVVWASVHRALGEFDEMWAKLRQAEAVANLHRRARAGTTASTRYLNCVGGLYRERNECADAERMFELARRMDPGKIGALSNLGLLYYLQKRNIEAERLLKRALRIARKTHSHPSLASMLHNLGVVYQARGNYANAEPYTRIVEYKKLSGYKSPSTLLGIEVPSTNGKHYPLPIKKFRAIHDAYAKRLGKNVYSIGRAGKYDYQVDIDDCIEQALGIYEELK